MGTQTKQVQDSLLITAKPKMAAPIDDVEALDQRHEDKDFQGLYDDLAAAVATEEGAANIELVWRFARANYDMCTASEGKDDKERFANAGVEWAEKALALDENHFGGNKWTAICLGQAGDFKGTTEKIQDSYRVKELADRAIELKPDDSATYHLLGRWCFIFADMGMVMKTLAATIFATPPESTFDDALQYFLKAADTTDLEFMLNDYWTAKTYAKLKNNDEAKVWFDKVLDREAVTPEHEKLHADAQKDKGALDSWW